MPIRKKIHGISQSILKYNLQSLREILHFVQKRSSLAEGKSNDTVCGFLEE